MTGGLPGREKYAIVKSGFCELLFIFLFIFVREGSA